MSTNVEETWDRIDVILEHCLAAIQDQGCSIEECLDLYPEQRTELDPLLRLAVQLQAGRDIKTTPRFKTTTLMRLRSMAAVSSSQRRKPVASISRSRLRLALGWVAALAVVLIAAFAYTIAASAQALPGDLLYPVKRAQEQVQLTLTIDVADRAGLHLKYANRRIVEAVTLAGQGRAVALEQVLADYNARMQQEYSLLVQASGLSPDQKLDLAGKLLSNLSGLESSLASLGDQAPPSAQTNIQAALAATHKVQNQAQEILREPENGQQPTSPLQERISITQTPTPTISTSTPTPSQKAPAGGSQLNPGSIPQPTSTPAPSRSTPTSGSQLSPGSAAPGTSAPATSTQSWDTSPGVKATATPASGRLASPTSPSSSIATQAATPGDSKPTSTAPVSLQPSDTPENRITPVTGLSPGASATPGR